MLHNYCFHLILDPNEDPRHINMKTIATCVQIIFLISHSKVFTPQPTKDAQMGKISATIETPSSSSTTDDVIWKFTERKMFWHKVRMRNIFQCKITKRIFFQNTKSQREKSSNTKSQALRFLSHHSQLQGLSLLLLSLGKKLCYLGFCFCIVFVFR